MFFRVIPNIISEDLHKYLMLLNRLEDTDNICSVFIELLLDEIAKNTGKEKLKKYKTEVKKYTLDTESSLESVSSKRRILFNIKTSRELGEAYPLFIALDNPQTNLIEVKHDTPLLDRDALYLEPEDNVVLLRPRCKHREASYLHIIED